MAGDNEEADKVGYAAALDKQTEAASLAKTGAIARKPTYQLRSFKTAVLTWELDLNLENE